MNRSDQLHSTATVFWVTTQIPVSRSAACSHASSWRVSCCLHKLAKQVYSVHLQFCLRTMQSRTE